MMEQRRSNGRIGGNECPSGAGRVLAESNPRSLLRSQQSQPRCSSLEAERWSEADQSEHQRGRHNGHVHGSQHGNNQALGLGNDNGNGTNININIGAAACSSNEGGAETESSASVHQALHPHTNTTIHVRHSHLHNAGPILSALGRHSPTRSFMSEITSQNDEDCANADNDPIEAFRQRHANNIRGRYNQQNQQQQQQHPFAPVPVLGERCFSGNSLGAALGSEIASSTGRGCNIQTHLVLNSQQHGGGTSATSRSTCNRPSIPLHRMSHHSHHSDQFLYQKNDNNNDMQQAQTQASTSIMANLSLSARQLVLLDLLGLEEPQYIGEATSESGASLSGPTAAAEAAAFATPQLYAPVTVLATGAEDVAADASPPPPPPCTSTGGSNTHPAPAIKRAPRCSRYQRQHQLNHLNHQWKRRHQQQAAGLDTNIAIEAEPFDTDETLPLQQRNVSVAQICDAITTITAGPGPGPAPSFTAAAEQQDPAQPSAPQPQPQLQTTPIPLPLLSDVVPATVHNSKEDDLQLLTHLIDEMGPNPRLTSKSTSNDGIANTASSYPSSITKDNHLVENDAAKKEISGALVTLKDENEIQYVDPVAGLSFDSKHNMPAHELVAAAAAAVAVPMHHDIHVDPAAAATATAASQLAEIHCDNSMAANITSTASAAADRPSRSIDNRVKDSIISTNATPTLAETAAKAHGHNHSDHQHVKNKQRRPLLYRHGEFSKNNKSSHQNVGSRVQDNTTQSRNTTSKGTNTTETQRDHCKDMAGEESSSSSTHYLSRKNTVAASAGGANWIHKDEDVMNYQQQQHQKTRKTMQDEKHDAKSAHQPGHEESIAAAIMTANAALTGLELAIAASASADIDATTTASSSPTPTTPSAIELSNHSAPAASSSTPAPLLSPTVRPPMVYKGKINKGNAPHLPPRSSITRQSSSSRDMQKRKSAIEPKSDTISLPTRRSINHQSSSSKDTQKRKSDSAPNIDNIPPATIAFAATVSSSSLMASSAPHQDTIFVAGDDNDDVEAQKGLRPRTRTDHKDLFRVVKETIRHNYPTQQKEQIRGDDGDANFAPNVSNHDRDATLPIVATNHNRKRKSGNNYETSGSHANTNANNQQEASRATGSISQGNTHTSSDECRNTKDGQSCFGHCHVCGFTWSTCDRLLFIMFLLSTCAAVVALILCESVLTHGKSQPPHL
jgi:hypothetical protein